MKTVGVASIGNRVAPRFDCAESLVMAETDPSGTLCFHEVHFRNNHPVRRVREIADLGIRTLICGALSSFVARMLEHHGIHVFDWVVGDTREILTLFLGRDLPRHDGRTGNRDYLHAMNCLRRLGPGNNRPRTGHRRGRRRGSFDGK